MKCNNIILISFLLLSISLSIDINQFSSFTDEISSSLAEIAGDLCVSQANNIYSDAGYKVTNFNASKVLNSIANNIHNRLKDKTKAVNLLKKVYEDILYKKPSVDNLAKSNEIEYCEDTDESLMKYDSGFLRLVNTDTNCLKIPWYVDETSKTVSDDIYLTSAIQNAFSTNYKNFPSLKWQYIGTHSGVFRNWPAYQTESYTSRGYEPETHPWGAFLAMTIVLPLLGFIVLMVFCCDCCDVIEDVKENNSICRNYRWAIIIISFIIITFTIFLSLTLAWPDFITPYDHRLRSWYVLSSSKPKDLVLVLDSSGSMSNENRMELAKRAAKSVLKTLGPDDYFGVVDFDNIIHKPFGCYANELAPATPQNIEFLSNFIDNIDGESGGTNFKIGFQQAFKMIRYSNRKSVQSVIVFLTDGQADDPFDLIGVEQSLLINSGFAHEALIYTYALGSEIGQTYLNNLKIIAQNYGGEFTHIPDSGDLRSAMGSYYSSSSLSYDYNQGQNNTVFSQPYYDAFGLGLVLTVAEPVFSQDGSLSAVVGADITINDVLASALAFLGTYSYAFLIDMTGKTIIHPYLPMPSSYEQNPFFLDITELEQNFNFISVKNSMLSGGSGSSSFTISHILHRGDSKQGGRTENILMNYYWMPIPEFPFSLAIVIADNEMNKMELGEVFYSNIKNYYHRIDLVPAPGTIYNSPYPTCTDPLGDLNLTKEVSTFKIAPKSFRDPYQYLQNGDYDADIDRGVKLVENYNTLFNSNFSRPQITEYFRPEVLDDVYLTSLLESCWKGFQKENYISKYIGTENGVFRIFPGTPFSKEYDPSRRPWYFRALSNPFDNSLSTYIDAISATQITTLSRAIKDPFNRISAVMGIDINAEYIETLIDSLFYRLFPDGDYIRFFIFDDSGYLIYHPDMTEESLFMRLLEADFTDMILQSYYTYYRCNNYQSLSYDSFWVYSNGMTTATTVKYATGCEGFVRKIPNSNAFLFLVTSDDCDNRCRECDLEEFFNPFYPCSDDGFCINSGLQSCRSCSSTQKLPCSCAIEYDACSNTFSSSRISCPPLIDQIPTFGEKTYCFAWWKIFLIFLSAAILTSILLYIFVEKTRNGIQIVYMVLLLLALSPILIFLAIINAICLIPLFINRKEEKIKEFQDIDIFSCDKVCFLFCEGSEVCCSNIGNILLAIILFIVFIFEIPLLLIIFLTYYKADKIINPIKNKGIFTDPPIYKLILETFLEILEDFFKILYYFFAFIVITCLIIFEIPVVLIILFTYYRSQSLINALKEKGIYLDLFTKLIPVIFWDLLSDFVLLIMLLITIPFFLIVCFTWRSFENINDIKKIENKQKVSFHQKGLEICRTTIGHFFNLILDIIAIPFLILFTIILLFSPRHLKEFYENIRNGENISKKRSVVFERRWQLQNTVYPKTDPSKPSQPSQPNCFTTCCDSVYEFIVLFFQYLFMGIFIIISIPFAPLLIFYVVPWYIRKRDTKNDSWKSVFFPNFVKDIEFEKPKEIANVIAYFTESIQSILAVPLIILNDITILITLIDAMFFFVFSFGFANFFFESILYKILITPFFGFLQFFIIMLPILWEGNNMVMFFTKGLFYHCSEAEISDTGCTSFWTDAYIPLHTGFLMFFVIVCILGSIKSLKLHYLKHWDHIVQCFQSNNSNSQNNTEVEMSTK